jgi:predicted nucleic acid-binding protein
MNSFLLDASALAKRYTLESGYPLVDYLFAQVKVSRLSCLLLGAGEVISVFVRKKNGGQISRIVFAQAMADFTAEVIQAGDFGKIEPDRTQVIDSWPLIEKHALNATDAVVLRVAMDRAEELRSQHQDLVLVAADVRLLRAAQSEGLATFNPETDAQTSLEALIGVSPGLPHAPKE